MCNTSNALRNVEKAFRKQCRFCLPPDCFTGKLTVTVNKQLSMKKNKKVPRIPKGDPVLLRMRSFVFGLSQDHDQDQAVQDKKQDRDYRTRDKDFKIQDPALQPPKIFGNLMCNFVYFMHFGKKPMTLVS